MLLFVVSFKSDFFFSCIKLLAGKWIQLEIAMLEELSFRRTNIVCFLVLVNSRHCRYKVSYVLMERSRRETWGKGAIRKTEE